MHMNTLTKEFRICLHEWSVGSEQSDLMGPAQHSSETQIPNQFQCPICELIRALIIVYPLWNLLNVEMG